MSSHSNILSADDDYVHLARKILNECSKEVEKKYKLKRITTGGSLAYDVRQVVIGFLYPAEATIPEARRIYVEIAEVFIKKYNGSKELRPYLRDYPFTLEHLALSIYFRNPKGDQPRKGMVAFTRGGTRDIDYEGQVSDDPKVYDPQEIFSESYVEALRIIREEKRQQLALEKS